MPENNLDLEGFAKEFAYHFTNNPGITHDTLGKYVKSNILSEGDFSLAYKEAEEWVRKRDHVREVANGFKWGC